MALLEGTILLMVAGAGLGLVLTRDPLRQAIMLSFYGLLWALAFFILRAPDVALSQIVIGAVILPLLICFALAKIRRQEIARARGARSESR